VRIGLLALSGWIVAAVMTVAVSWSAIGVVKSSVVPQTKVVTSALPTPEETGPTSAAPTSARPSPTLAAASSLSGQGGSVTARCTNGVPVIVQVIPQQGFGQERDDSNREVKLSSSDHRTEITIACSGGRAVLTKEEKAISAGGGDDGGGDDGGGRGRGGSGGGGGDDN
jgi:hypothetical protein